jgi:hypothetical protein
MAKTIITNDMIGEITRAVTAIVEHGVTTHRQGAIEYAKTLSTGEEKVDIKDYPTAIAALKKYGNTSRECRFYLSMDELAWMQKAFIPSEEFKVNIGNTEHVKKSTTVKKMISVQSLSYTELVLAWLKGDKSFRLYNHDSTRKTFARLEDLWMAKCCISLKNWKTGNTSAIGNWVSSLEQAMRPYLKFTVEGDAGSDPDNSRAVYTCRGTFDTDTWTTSDNKEHKQITVPVKRFVLDGWQTAATAMAKMTDAKDYVRPAADKLQRSHGVGQIKAEANVVIDNIMKLPSQKVQKMIRWNYTFVKDDEAEVNFNTHFDQKEKEMKEKYEKKLAAAKEAKAKKQGKA